MYGAIAVRQRLLPVVLLAGVWVIPASAAPAEGEAAAPASGALEEIVVTAQRREERLQDVPVSVLAFTQQKMDEQGLKNIDDLSRLSPGLAFQRNGMSSSGNYNDEGSDINIRGVDSTAGTSTVGIYIDDTPIQTRHIGFGSINAFPALFDLDHVEVLRGPQGTLFGAGAEGGVVRFITPEPDLSKTSIYARSDFAVTDGGAPSYEGGGAFGTPIIEDTLSFRASFSYRRDGGWVDRVGYDLEPNASVPLPTPVNNGVTRENDANYWETTTARFALKWKVNDALEIMPSFYYQHLHINDTAAYWVALSNPGSQTYNNGNAGTNPSHDPFTLTAIRIKWDVGFASFFSNTAFYDRNQNADSDYTQYLRATWNSFGELPNTFPKPGDNGYATFEDDQRNFYEEVRLASKDADARFVWTGGLFYSHLSENVPENIYDATLEQEVSEFTGLPPNSVPVPVCTTAQPCPNGLIYTGPLDKVIDEQLALFGDLTWRITDTWKATAGLRLSRIDFTGSVAETGPFLGTTIVTSSSATEKPVTPKAVLTWQPDKDNMVYASASKGFRPGGVNIGVSELLCAPNLTPLGLTQVPGQFSSDSLWSYEIGAKNTFLDHTLEVDTSIFYIDWNNIQQNVYLSACGEQFTANLGKAKSEGGDIEIIYRPVTQLTFDVTGAYTDARLTKSSCAGSAAFVSAIDGCLTAGEPVVDAARPIASNGDALLGAPWAITISMQYEFPEWDGRKPYFRADYQYDTAQKSKLQGQDPNNAIFDDTLPGLPIISDLSLRAGLRFNGFDVSLYANNVTNAHPLEFEARDIYPYPGPPGTGASQNGPTTDTLYFGRGVRPRTIGITATYRY